MDTVFFFYGLGFFVLGATVVAQPRRENASDLVRSMWLFGIFGLLHGAAEWMVLLEPAGGRAPLARLAVSTASFLFLFEFGRRLLRLALLARRNASGARATQARFAYALPVLGLLGHTAFSDGPAALDAWVRYSLAVPGALAAGLGLLAYARCPRHGGLGAEARLILTGLAAAFFAYGLFSAVVPPANFFPARLLNEASFLQLTGMPVQLPRTATAWFFVVASGRIFHLLHVEARRELQTALSEATALRRRSELILETTDNAICGIDSAGRITFANLAAAHLLGWPRSQLLGRLFGDFRQPAAADAQQGPPPPFPCPTPYHSDREWFVRRDGTRFPAEYSSTPRHNGGEVTCAVLAFRDITERRQSEFAERWAQEQRFRAVFEQAAVGIALLRLDGRCLQVNERLCRILDRSPGDLLDSPFEAFMHPDEKRQCPPLREQMLRGDAGSSSVLETRCLRGENEPVWVQLTFSLVRDPAEVPQYCVLVVEDITERKQAEAALLRSQADLERSQGIARLGSWALDLGNLRMHWSNETVHILGRAEPEYTPSLKTFLLATHPADMAEVEAAFQSWFTEPAPADLEYRIRWPDGEERFVHVVVRTEQAGDGSPERAVGTIQDITERKQTEQILAFYRDRLEQLVEARTRALAASNRDLESANRELEAFSYSVSHDLRGPLRAINGFTHALEEDYAERLDSEACDYIARVRSATVRMGELIDGLLNLARVFRSDCSAEPVNMSAVARGIARQLQADEPARQVDFDIEPEVVATGDPVLLRLLMQNLLGNAWKFSASRPNPRIRFGRETGETGDVFYVGDSGIGFEMEYAHKLFQPFERLHAQGEYEGTGIGLATVRRVVQRHGGQVWAAAELERGATIYFTLAGPAEAEAYPSAI